MLIAFSQSDSDLYFTRVKSVFCLLEWANAHQFDRLNRNTATCRGFCQSFCQRCFRGPMPADFLPPSEDDQDLDDLLLHCVGDTADEDMLLPPLLDEALNQHACDDSWRSEVESPILCQRCRADASSLTKVSLDSLPLCRDHAVVWALVPTGVLRQRCVVLELPDWPRAQKGWYGNKLSLESGGGKRKRRKAGPRKKRLCLVCKTKGRMSDQAMQCPGRWQRKRCPP
jgi:hypothetical protein